MSLRLPHQSHQLGCSRPLFLMPTTSSPRFHHTLLRALKLLKEMVAPEPLKRLHSMKASIYILIFHPILDNLIHKISTHTIKSTEIIEGNGGPEPLKRLHSMKASICILIFHPILFLALLKVLGEKLVYIYSPSWNVTFLTVPGPPFPSIISVLLIVCGEILGMSLSDKLI